jgi:hypothetical protein
MAQPYSHPRVISATFTGDRISFRVDVSDFKPGDGIEISGQATQSSGAFANIYTITRVPATPNGYNGEHYVDVTAVPIPASPFRKDQDVTIFMRVSKAWVTVLGEHNGSQADGSLGQTADAGTAWDQVSQTADVGTTWDQVRWSADPWGGSLPPAQSW